MNLTRSTASQKTKTKEIVAYSMDYKNPISVNVTKNKNVRADNQPKIFTKDLENLDKERTPPEIIIHPYKC